MRREKRAGRGRRVGEEGIRNRVGKTTKVYIIVKACITGFLAPDMRRDSAHSNSDFCPNSCSNLFSYATGGNNPSRVTERTVNACESTPIPLPISFYLSPLCSISQWWVFIYKSIASLTQLSVTVILFHLSLVPKGRKHPCYKSRTSRSGFRTECSVRMGFKSRDLVLTG